MTAFQTASPNVTIEVFIATVTDPAVKAKSKNVCWPSKNSFMPR